MSFSDLSSILQTIYMVKFEFFIKIVLILVGVFSCWLYISQFEPNRNSPYMAVRYIRGALYVMCWFLLLFSPLSVFLLYPQVSLDVFLKILLFIYSTGMLFGGLLIGFNVLQYGVHFLFSLLGMENKLGEMNNGLIPITGRGIKKFEKEGISRNTSRFKGTD